MGLAVKEKSGQKEKVINNNLKKTIKLCKKKEILKYLKSITKEKIEHLIYTGKDISGEIDGLFDIEEDIYDKTEIPISEIIHNIRKTYKQIIHYIINYIVKVIKLDSESGIYFVGLSFSSNEDNFIKEVETLTKSKPSMVAELDNIVKIYSKDKQFINMLINMVNNTFKRDPVKNIYEEYIFITYLISCIIYYNIISEEKFDKMKNEVEGHLRKYKDTNMLDTMKNESLLFYYHQLGNTIEGIGTNLLKAMNFSFEDNTDVKRLKTKESCKELFLERLGNFKLENTEIAKIKLTKSDTYKGIDIFTAIHLYGIIKIVKSE